MLFFYSIVSGGCFSFLRLLKDILFQSRYVEFFWVWLEVFLLFFVVFVFYVMYYWFRETLRFLFFFMFICQAFIVFLRVIFKYFVQEMVQNKFCQGFGYFCGVLISLGVFQGRVLIIVCDMLFLFEWGLQKDKGKGSYEDYICCV